MEKETRKVFPIEASLIEKIDNLLLYLYEKTSHFGQVLEINSAYFHTYKASDFGSQNRFELGNLFKALTELGYIENFGTFNETDERGFQVQVPHNLRISVEGIKHCNSLLNSGINSTNCFVAMAFHKETDKAYISIEKILKSNSFKPIRVDREHINSEQTINDFIIASIKASRFCIADFTHNREGVYFEAGYALGRGLKVIYTCHTSHFDKVHFDLKPLQFIVYENEAQLEDALDLKIKSFIID